MSFSRHEPWRPRQLFLLCRRNPFVTEQITRTHAALAQGASEDNSTAPIMVAHTVKTARAAMVESKVLGARLPLVAAGRFLASPKRERFVYNATLEAIDFTRGRAKGD